MRSAGIFVWFGYDLSFEEALRKIKANGFETVLLWWGEFEGSVPLKKQPEVVQKLGLSVENAHAPYLGCNDLWLPGEQGILYANQLVSCIKGCSEAGVPTLVVHLTDRDEPIPCDRIGLERLKPVVEAAEQYRVTLAFENLQQIVHLETVLDTFSSPYVGFCYDSGHHNCCFKDLPLLNKYGDRLVALHLHDNDSTADQHKLPFDGNINWKSFTQAIRKIGYRGSLTLEVQTYNGYEQQMDADAFLKKAFNSIQKIQLL